MFSTYAEYEHQFETRIGEKISTYGYGNVKIKISDHQGNINILTVTNMSRALELSHNLLNTMLLARKVVEIFLRKAGQPSKIIIDEEIFDLADIIENQYVIWLTETLKSATVN